jgi:asparagine synthase (glutamine-hydrolysing)|tara:strand:- start:1058 stop:1801 length:744 start_codon:yes stop_codon:yes gene_type:complete
VNQLLDEIITAIKTTVLDKSVGVAFSGGVDSTLIAKLLNDNGYDIHLLTIGFQDSHDINFAKEVNEILKFKHDILEIESESFQKISEDVHDIIKTDNLSWNENSIAFYYVSKLAKNLDLSTVVTANGIDELFCGYNVYREAIGVGVDEVMNVMNKKLDNEKKMMIAVNNVTSRFNVRILQPLLNDDFISYAKTIPVSEKITSPDDLQRKHVIRKLALSCGVPELSANKQKKALQYGSKIHKQLLKLR